jgi:hypothetical protein
MGRSGKRNKLSRSLTRSAQKNRLENQETQRDQLALFDLGDPDIKTMTGLASEYSTGDDHAELVFAASIVWKHNPNLLFDHKEAFEIWKNQAIGPNIDPVNHPNDSKEFWDKALAAFSYEVEQSTPSQTGPHFRGQPFNRDHPVERLRGWSDNLDTALRFSLDHPTIVNGAESRRANIFTGLEINLAPGEKVVVSLYVLDQAEHGFSFNSNPINVLERKKEIINRASKGGPYGLYEFLREDGLWVKDDALLKIETLKKEIIKEAINKLSPERIEQLTSIDQGIDQYSREYRLSSSSKEIVSSLINEMENQAMLKEWEDMHDQLSEHVFGQNLPALSHHHPNEEEMVIAPSDGHKMRRLDIVLANNNQDLKDLDEESAIEKMRVALKNQTGYNPAGHNPRQQPLFFDF